MPDQVFTAGQILTAQNQTDLQNNIGLVPIVPTSCVGGTIAANGIVTIGTSVSSVAISGAFSSSFDVYKILTYGGSATTGSQLRLTLGATATGYSYGGSANSYAAGTAATQFGANVAFWRTGEVNPEGLPCDITLSAPNLAKRSSFYANQTSLSAGQFGMIGGFLDNNTQYTDFTLTFPGNSVTGGFVAIYGYRK
jgi:hypothetical protein